MPNPNNETSSVPLSSLHLLEERMGYRFTEISLLDEAVTHRSYSQEQSPPSVDNQRLEFLGDAVLQLIVTDRLWKEDPLASEGDLTRERSNKVRGRSLAKAARQLGLTEFLRVGRGEEKTGGRSKPSILADALEAIVGAVYLDSGYEECAELVFGWLWSPEAAIRGEDYKSRLQEEFQRRGRKPPSYRVVRELGPQHRKIFEVEVLHDSAVLGRGVGKSKKEADQEAARVSLVALEKIGAGRRAKGARPGRGD